MHNEPQRLYGKQAAEARLRAAIIKIGQRFIARADANTAETYLGLCSPALASGFENRLPAVVAQVHQENPIRVEALVLMRLDEAVRAFWCYCRTDLEPAHLGDLLRTLEDWAEHGWYSYKPVADGIYFRLEKA